jgi:putative transposase
MDEFSRSGLALELAFSFPSRSVVAVLDDLGARYGYPKYLRIDNGTELTSKIMQQWSEDHDVELLFIQPGKPTQNAYIESFNSRVRSEFLNAHWFRSLLDARNGASTWMHSYNTTHAHSALGYRTPKEFLATYETTPIPQESLARNGSEPNRNEPCVAGRLGILILQATANCEVDGALTRLSSRSSLRLGPQK